MTSRIGEFAAYMGVDAYTCHLLDTFVDSKRLLTRVSRAMALLVVELTLMTWMTWIAWIFVHSVGMVL